MIKKRLRKFSAVILATMILSMSGCNFSTNNNSHSYRAVSEKSSSSETVTSRDIDSDINTSRNTDSDISTSRNTYSAVSSSRYTDFDSNTLIGADSDTNTFQTISLPDVSLPTMSIPTFSIPSFNASAIGSETASNSSSETSSEKTSSETFSSSSSSGFAPISGETQTVGNSEIGYLDIPADFIKFIDVVPNTDLQYSDKSTTTIFTMNTIDTDPAYIESAAQIIAKRMQDNGAKGVTGAHVTVAEKYEAIQVYGYWSEDDSFLVTDLFEADGRLIYLSVEFPSENIDIVSYLDTYHR